MSGTIIRLKNGVGEYSNWLSSTFNTLSICEPWVNKTSKQVFVDGVALNPTLVSTDDTITVGSIAINGGVATQNLSVNLANIGLQNLTFSKAANNQFVYNPTTANTLTLGNGLTLTNSTIAVGLAPVASGQSTYLSFDSNGLLRFNPGDLIKDRFLSSVTYVDKTLHFVWNADTDNIEIDIPLTDLVDEFTDTDTVTKLEAGNLIGVTLTPTTFTNDAVNTYTVSHEAVTAPADAISTNQTPAFGETFNIISGVEEDGYGHVTGFKTKTVTLPSPEAAINTTYDLTGTAKADKTEAYVTLAGSDNSEDIVTIKHTPQANAGGTKVEWAAANNVITMDIVVIDGGTF